MSKKAVKLTCLAMAGVMVITVVVGAVASFI